MKKASIKVYIYSIDYYEQEFHYLFLHIYIMKKEPLHFHLSPVLSATTTLAALSFSSHHTLLFIIYICTVTLGRFSFLWIVQNFTQMQVPRVRDISSAA